jgi:hypothetical protein
MDSLNWRKARASAANGSCVEVADRDGKVLVRDTKNRDRLTLAVTSSAWRSLISDVKRGRFDG